MAEELISTRELVDGASLPVLAPEVVITRLHVLLGGEEAIYFDADHQSDDGGTMYTMAGVTKTSAFYLRVEHDDAYWSYNRALDDRSAAGITPRSVTSWRRPLRAATHVTLDGDPHDWLAGQGATPPNTSAIRLHFGDVDVRFPLSSRFRERRPDLSPVFARLNELWG